ncbi:hypothetical protein BUALT_Bualt01G0214800 [Buddleja alternifolia]|uniref:Cytochrome P450 n=1 Tax=Buddleja alternifolia TaxID=168488 RepID=A0AAV6YJG2_9LAMI|nr:hypothetical protein BUALT_Bualt01G0214800 [Buddleja alternifolia]
MDILYAIFSITITSILLIFILFSALLLKTFTKKSIKNPNYPPVVGTVFDQLLYFNKLYDYQTNMALKYKTFRLLAPDQSEIYTIEPKNIEYILKTNFSKYSKGQYNQDILKDLFGQGIINEDGEKWLQQRKLASVEFSTRVLRDFSCSVFRKNAEKLVKTIYGFSEKNQDFDVQGMLMRCTLDSIFKVGFGVDLNCLEGSNEEGNEFIKAFDDSNELVYWRYANPLWKIKRYLNIGGEATLKKNIKIIHNFVDKLIKTKKDQMEKEQYYGTTDEALEEMHYLHATLTETLRLYPAVPVDGRCAETDDTLPDGFKLRKGDGVYYMAYAMGRMPYVWGEDAQEFKPERWFKNGIFQPQSPFKFVAFHGGPRICLGKDFAYRQMKIVSAALVHFFRFKLSDESTRNVTYRTMLTLHISGTLNIHAVPRIGSL